MYSLLLVWSVDIAFVWSGSQFVSLTFVNKGSHLRTWMTWVDSHLREICSHLRNKFDQARLVLTFVDFFKNDLNWTSFIYGQFVKLILNHAVNNLLDFVGLEACSKGKAAIDWLLELQSEVSVGSNLDLRELGALELHVMWITLLASMLSLIRSIYCYMPWFLHAYLTSMP